MGERSCKFVPAAASRYDIRKLDISHVPVSGAVEHSTITRKPQQTRLLVTVVSLRAPRGAAKRAKGTRGEGATAHATSLTRAGGHQIYLRPRAPRVEVEPAAAARALTTHTRVQGVSPTPREQLGGAAAAQLHGTLVLACAHTPRAVRAVRSAGVPQVDGTCRRFGPLRPTPATAAASLPVERIGRDRGRRGGGLSSRRRRPPAARRPPASGSAGRA